MMYLLAVIFAVPLVSCSNSTKNVFIGLDFLFLSNPRTPSIVLVDPKTGNHTAKVGGDSFTACAFMKPDSTSSKLYHVFMSYAVTMDNDILVEFQVQINKTLLHIIGKIHYLNITPPMNVWTHLCISWQSSSGVIQYYFNGTKVAEINNASIGKTIKDDGYLVFAQDQDAFDGGFDPDTGFRGRMTQINVWNRALTLEEVKQVQSGMLYGDAVDWRNATWSMSDHTMIERSEAPRTPYTIENSGGNCKKINGTPTDLSFCFRIRGKECVEKNLVLSYIYKKQVPELSLVIAKDERVSIILNNQTTALPSLILTREWQHWCFVWYNKTGILKIYVDSCMKDAVSNFKNGTAVSAGGDLLIFGGSAEKRSTILVTDSCVWERVIELNEVIRHYHSPSLWQQYYSPYNNGYELTSYGQLDAYRRVMNANWWNPRPQFGMNYPPTRWAGR